MQPPKKIRPFTMQHFRLATEAVRDDPRLPASVAKTLELALSLVGRVFKVETQCASPDIGLARAVKGAQPFSLSTRYTDRMPRKAGFGQAIGFAQDEDDCIIAEPHNARAFRIEPGLEALDPEAQALLGLVSMLKNCRSHAAGLWATARG